MNTLIRILWFVTVGWFLGLLWFSLSVLLMLSLVFFPIGAYAATKTWTVMTLKESPQKVVVDVNEHKESSSQ